MRTCRVLRSPVPLQAFRRAATKTSRHHEMTDLKGNIFFEGPAGRIEAIWKQPSNGAVKAAIVCHPHPLFGGTMHNKVVFQIARAFERLGYAVLRFNFRGTGLSEGTHDKGNAEQDDLRAAIEFVLERAAQDRLWLAGFSFGSAVMLKLACSDARVFGFVAAGTPVGRYELDEVARCAKPKLFVQGENDQFGPVAELGLMIESLPDPKELRVIDAADHFFEGRLPEVSKAVSEFVTQYE
jgi:alpha/beta superfamily hydrolase